MAVELQLPDDDALHFPGGGPTGLTLNLKF